jgi:hypothetical protein
LNFGRESGGGNSSSSGHKRAFSLPLRGGDKRDAAALAAAASSARGAKEGANNSAVDTSGIYCLFKENIGSSLRHPFRLITDRWQKVDNVRFGSLFRIRIHLTRIRIRIQHFMLNSDPDPDPILTAEKKINFFSKTTIYLFLGLHKRRPSYRRSFQLPKENIQHFKTWKFLIFFYFFVGHFCPPGSGSTDLIESGSNPDPKHWF